MALSLVTPATDEPVTLAEVKAQCRIDASITDEDALLNALRRAAREYVETFTRRALMASTWDYMLDAFPGWGEISAFVSARAIVLPLSPVTSVTSISYVDTNGATQTWSASLYQTDLPSGPQAARARIEPAYAQWYPTTRCGTYNAVTVRFVAGYASAAAVPYSLKAAIKMLVAHWYMNREPVTGLRYATPIPLTIESLLWPFASF